MNLFGDSSGWLAMYDENDKYHTVAKNALRRFAEHELNFVVTDYVVAETLTLMLGRLGHQKATAFGRWLLDAPRVKQVRITPEIWNEAWLLFQRYDDKEFSFVDCLSFVVMRREKLTEAFTFDRHFQQMGFRLWPR